MGQALGFPLVPKTSYHISMKSESHAPISPEQFRRFVRGIVNVPGAEVRKEIEREHKARMKKRAKTSPASRDSNVREH